MQVWHTYLLTHTCLAELSKSGGKQRRGVFAWATVILIVVSATLLFVYTRHVFKIQSLVTCLPECDRVWCFDIILVPTRLAQQVRQQALTFKIAVLVIRSCQTNADNIHLRNNSCNGIFLQISFRYTHEREVDTSLRTNRYCGKIYHGFWIYLLFICILREWSLLCLFCIFEWRYETCSRRR